MGDGIIRARPMGKGPGRGPWSDNEFGADPDDLPGAMSPQQQEFVRAELQTTFRTRAALDAFGLGRP